MHWYVSLVEGNENELGECEGSINSGEEAEHAEESEKIDQASAVDSHQKEQSETKCLTWYSDCKC